MTENLELFPPPAPDGRAQAAIEIVALREQLNRWAHEYYVQDAPSVPDGEYDRVFQQLQALEASYPQIVTPDSPTQRVIGAVLDGLTPVRHAMPMLSIYPILALRYGHEELASLAVAVTTLATAITLTVLLWAVQHILHTDALGVF